METLFLTVLRMSGTAALVIAAVLLARLLLRRAPKIFSYALWLVALFRLLCPVSVSSGFSLLPAVQTQPAGAEHTSVHIHTGITAMNSQVNEYLAEHPYPVEFTPPEGEGGAGAAYLEGVSRMVETADPGWTAIACWVWLAGAAALLGYSALSTLGLRRKLAASIPLEGEKNVRLADHIPSPFVLGLARPGIYLPSDLRPEERDYILLHERTHIRRGDHIFRALAWLALAIHWFNPLVWLAFHLAGKDMEMSCDEAVLRGMDRDVRADYSSSLLRLSAGKRLPAGPLAFGDGDPKSRIKNILNYKKPALWVIAAALVVVICAGAALATNPGRASGPGKPADFVFHEPGPAECWLDYGTGLEGLPWDAGNETELPEFPGVTFRWTSGTVSAVTGDGEMELMGGMPIYSVYLCDLNGDGCRELCAASYFGSGLIDARVQVYDYQHQGLHRLEDRGARDYSLQLDGDRLWAVEREYPDGQILRAGPLVMTEEGLDIQNEFTGIVLPGAELTFSLEEDDDGPIVRMEGSVDGTPLRRNAVWWARGLETLFGGHSGGVSMSWQFSDGSGAEVNAWWADEGRTAVTLSTQMSAMVSSVFNVGWWDFTVNLAQDGGTVAEMVDLPLRPAQTGSNAETRYYPASISDEDAVRAARTAAKLLTAAEDYYNNVKGARDAAADSQSADQLPPYFRIPETDGGRVLIEGLGDAHVEWNASGSLYVAGDGSCFLPDRLKGCEISGYAAWTDEARNVLFVSLERADAGGLVQFTEDIDRGKVTRTNEQAAGGEELLELTDSELQNTANFMATLMIRAEDCYSGAGGVQDAPGLARYTGRMCSFDYDPRLFRVNEELDHEDSYGTSAYVSAKPIEAETLGIYFSVERIEGTTVEEYDAWLRNNRNLDPGQESVVIGAGGYSAVKQTWTGTAGYAVGEHYLIELDGAVYVVTLSSYSQPPEELLAAARASLDSLVLGIYTFPGSIPYGSFSWPKDSAAYRDGPGVRRDGFVNAGEEPVDFGNVLDRAKAELDRDWGEASISRDEQARMWRVDFFESTPLRPTEICSVYLSDEGATRLIVYGE